MAGDGMEGTAKHKVKRIDQRGRRGKNIGETHGIGTDAGGLTLKNKGEIDGRRHSGMQKQRGNARNCRWPNGLDA